MSDKPDDFINRAKTYAARLSQSDYPIEDLLKGDPDYKKISGLAQVIDRHIRQGADYERVCADIVILRGIQKKNSERDSHADKIQAAVDKHFGIEKPISQRPDDLEPEPAGGPKKPQFSGGAAALINPEEGKGRG